ncbi:mycobacterial cell wall arabinan synthesis family protein [Rhodococcus sp. MTM3W5.2]|nr:mycobacterial cell wall arabinan synthesis family protein [Rhodococcus sp. MTM3W5.2]
MSDAPESTPADRTSLRTARLIAVVAGLAGLLLAVLTPLLPVKQTTASVSWPQNGALTSVSAPLVSYEPLSLSAHIPCAVATQLPPDGQVLLSTAPSRRRTPSSTASPSRSRAIPRARPAARCR